MKKLKMFGVLALIMLTSAIVVACKKGQDYSIEFVSVTLTVEASSAAQASGKVFAPEDFPEVNLSKVETFDYSMPYTGKLHLDLYLQKPSKKNVKEAIEKLKHRSDIELVELAYPATAQ